MTTLSVSGSDCDGSRKGHVTLSRTDRYLRPTAMRLDDGDFVPADHMYVHGSAYWIPGQVNKASSFWKTSIEFITNTVHLADYGVPEVMERRIMVLRNVDDHENYSQLGFVPDQLSLSLKVGRVELKALDYPLGGVALFFSGVRRDTMAQFEIKLPNHLSSEMVAGMIYANVARCFPEDASAWRRHFQSLKLPLFQ